MWDNFKLVMIDDDPMEHVVMKKMLSRYDLFKNSAHSFDGRIVIDSLRENCMRPEALPDVILTDLNMTRFTGWLFLEQFNALYPSLKKHIDVYVISSSPDPADPPRAKTYPFVRDFIHKPVTFECLDQLYLACKKMKRMAG